VTSAQRASCVMVVDILVESSTKHDHVLVTEPHQTDLQNVSVLYFSDQLMRRRLAHFSKR